MIKWHPIRVLRWTGFFDGLSLLILLCIAMPLKYFAHMPLAVTIVGSMHGFIFIAYACAILFVQLRIQWNVGFSLLSVIIAFIPFGNIVFDFYLKKKEHLPLQPFKKSWVVYCIIFFTFIDLFTQLPVMSTYAMSIGASAAFAGFIVGIYSLSNTIGNIFSGIATDKYGSFIVLFIGLIATSVALSLYSFVDSIEMLIIVRFLHGLLGGLIVPAAFALLANITREEEQGSKSAVTGAFVGVAAILGPAYSGIMASVTSVPFVFMTVAIFGACLILLMLVFMRTLGRKVKQSTAYVKEKLSWNRGLIQSYAGAFFLMFSQGALAYLLPLQAEALGYSSRLSGTLLSVFGIVAVLFFVLPTNKLFDRVQPVWTLFAGLFILGMSQLLISQMTTAIALYFVLALYGFGFALLFPSINTMLIRSTTEAVRGKAYGYFYAFFSLGVVVGSSGLGLTSLSLQGNFMLTGVLLIFISLMLLAIQFMRASRLVREKKC